MFKSSFTKYLTVIILIIFLSFLILSGIITVIIRNYVTKDVEEKLEITSDLVVDYLEGTGVENIAAHNFMDELSSVVTPIINFDTRYDVLVSDPSGKVLLTSVGKRLVDSDGTKKVDYDIKDGFTKVDFKSFKREKVESGETFLVHNGDLGGYLDESSIVYAKAVVIKGKTVAYVFTLSSTEYEDKLVEITRGAVINSSVWVMLAAVIATYFITNRMTVPLKSMTSASKKFAKGDFSARVTVYGKDEVSELARAFNNMADSLESLEKMRSSFLASVSHDLRTPMTTILGFIEGITSGAIPPEKHEYYLGVISAEVHRLSRLVTQLLDISKLESGERKFNFESFDVAEVARIILISFEQKIEDKKLDVEFISDEDEMLAYADKDAIYQVIYNLCHNAIKFSRPEGKFIISIKKTAASKISVSVFDEGESLSEEDSKMVFDRFYKSDKSRGLDKSGVGLGLYICKTIIDAHGETISVKSIEGESTEFTFTLKESPEKQKRKPLIGVE